MKYCNYLLYLFDINDEYIFFYNDDNIYYIVSNDKLNKT